MQEESPKRPMWPSTMQTTVERVLIAAVLVVYGIVAYMNFYDGRVRGPLAIHRYYHLGDFDKFRPVNGKFDLNQNLKNFDVTPLLGEPGKNIPSGEKEITVPPATADN